jgi:hypothetical protein
MRSKRIFSLFFVLALLAAPGAACAGDLIYAAGHDHTPPGQPVRYWKVGVTSKPPPKGVHPEYALGKPDGRLAGWARKDGTLVLGFDAPGGLKNIEGPDLFFWHFGTGGTRVYVSTQADNPTDWQLIGDLPITKEHAVEKHGMNFGQLDRVRFIKIDKWDAGFWGKGRFIDAVGGYCE